VTWHQPSCERLLAAVGQRLPPLLSIANIDDAVACCDHLYRCPVQFILCGRKREPRRTFSYGAVASLDTCSPKTTGPWTVPAHFLPVYRAVLSCLFLAVVCVFIFIPEHPPCANPGFRADPEKNMFARTSGPIRRLYRILHRNFPSFNFITLHYIYFLTTCLLTSVIFWGASTPARSISYTDALFMTVSAMTLA
jgi:hypothetical protein